MWAHGCPKHSARGRFPATLPSQWWGLLVGNHVHPGAGAGRETWDRQSRGDLGRLQEIGLFLQVMC